MHRYASRPETAAVWSVFRATAPAPRLPWIDWPGPTGTGKISSTNSRSRYRMAALFSLSPLECIDTLAKLIPPPRRHLHRYHGVLAPNSPLRAAVTKSSPEVEPARGATDDSPSIRPGSSDDQAHTEQPSSTTRPLSCYLWMTLMARIYESFPLVCPLCAHPMRIVAFITENRTNVRTL